MSEATVDPGRPISHEELKALVTVEVAERLAVLAAGAIRDGQTDEALALLEELTALTTSRTATAVKSQANSDVIGMRAAAQVRMAVERVVGSLADRTEATA
jgi:hypothetical protein